MAKPVATISKLFLFSIIAALLSVLFVFLGTPLLRVLRNSFGSWKYWTLGLFISFALFTLGLGPIGIWLLSIWLTIGIYSELEEKGRAGVTSLVASTLTGTALLMGAIYGWFQTHQLNLLEVARKTLTDMLAPLGTSSKINVDVILQQSPSLVFITLLVGLAFALILDRRVAVIMGLPYEKVSSQIRLLELRLPDSMVWITMFSMLLAFLNMVPPSISAIGMNIFNVMMAGYFFQGLAVIEVAFSVYRIGSLIRLFIYIFFIGQLFLVVSAIGFIDYWVDFRKKLRVLVAASRRNQNNGENR